MFRNEKYLKVEKSSSRVVWLAGWLIGCYMYRLLTAINKNFRNVKPVKEVKIFWNFKSHSSGVQKRYWDSQTHKNGRIQEEGIDELFAWPPIDPKVVGLNLNVGKCFIWELLNRYSQLMVKIRWDIYLFHKGSIMMAVWSIYKIVTTTKNLDIYFSIYF